MKASGLSQIWGGIAAIVALLLLVLTVSQIRAPAQASTPADPGDVKTFPIPRGSLEAARQSFETRRLRYALHAYRYLWSDWPTTLAQLESAGFAEAGALAGSSGQPYYYAKSDEAALLLAPPR